MFKKAQLTPVDVEGTTVYVRPLNAGGLARLLHEVDKAKESGEPWKTDFNFVACSVLDIDNNRVFKDADEVAEQSPGLVATLLQACLKANGIGDTDAKKN